MKNMYEVRFDTYRQGMAILYALHLEAKNKKEAKARAEEMWYQEKEDTRHMFHMTVERIPETGEFLRHWFHKLETRFYNGNRQPYMNCPDYHANK